MDPHCMAGHGGGLPKKVVAIGAGRFPPGYRFMPTDEELIVHYLLKKVKNEPIPIDEIPDVNLIQNTPMSIAEKYPKLGEHEWYFFTPRERKYPQGTRPNRKAGDGYWKATGADKNIDDPPNSKNYIGHRKALVFYQGQPPNGVKTNWIMHEFKLAQPPREKTCPEDMRLDDWVLCRIHEKLESSERPHKRRRVGGIDRESNVLQVSPSNNGDAKKDSNSSVAVGCCSSVNAGDFEALDNIIPTFDNLWTGNGCFEDYQNCIVPPPQPIDGVGFGVTEPGSIFFNGSFSSLGLEDHGHVDQLGEFGNLPNYDSLQHPWLFDPPRNNNASMPAFDDKWFVGGDDSFIDGHGSLGEAVALAKAAMKSFKGREGVDRNVKDR